MNFKNMFYIKFIARVPPFRSRIVAVRTEIIQRYKFATQVWIFISIPDLLKQH